MCEFISWKEVQGKYYYLTDEIIAPRLDAFKGYNPNWTEDLAGHGAIEWFFDLPHGCGRNQECTEFSKSTNFPAEIAAAIRAGKITYGRPFPRGLLRAPLDADYEAKRAPLYADYEAKRDSLDADYKAKRAPLDKKQWALFAESKNRAKAWQ